MHNYGVDRSHSNYNRIPNQPGHIFIENKENHLAAKTKPVSEFGSDSIVNRKNFDHWGNLYCHFAYKFIQILKCMMFNVKYVLLTKVKVE